MMMIHRETAGGSSSSSSNYAAQAEKVEQQLKDAGAKLEDGINQVILSSRTKASKALAAKDQMLELELRFGVVGGGASTTAVRPFTQTDYENVGRAAFRHGWKSAKISGDTILRIIPNNNNNHASSTSSSSASGRNSSLRAEIHGDAAITAYCRGNTLESVLGARAVSAAVNQETVFFTRKQNIGETVHFTDLEFRVSLARETRIAASSEDDAEVAAARKNWAVSDKYFRYMKRTRVQREDGGCVALDLSTVHSNRRAENNRQTAVLGRTPTEVGLFSDQHFHHVEYEIELELDNAVVAQMLKRENKKKNAAANNALSSMAPEQEADKLTPAEKRVAAEVLSQIKHAVRIVTGALQNDSRYPIGRLERNSVLAEYMGVLSSALPSSSSLSTASSTTPLKPVFAGPNSVTLMQKHCAQIVDNYCVTDKADGQRALLFVSKTTKPGRVYMITNALEVQWTGVRSDAKECQHLLLDGEYITHGKGGAALNLFAAFDLYVAQGEVRMGLPFADLVYGTPTTTASSSSAVSSLPPYRLPQLQYFAAKLDASLAEARTRAASQAGGAACLVTVRAKEFYLGSTAPGDSTAASIFAQSKAMLNRYDEYDTDGLIFTPTDTAVNGTHPVFQRMERPAVAVRRERATNDNVDSDSDDDDSSTTTPLAVLPTREQVSAALSSYKLERHTWQQSFKWKPAEQNTIDFLVTVQTPEAQHLTVGARTVFYKRLKLLCGVNTREANRTAAQVAAQATYDMLMDKPAAADKDNEEVDRNGLEKLSAVGGRNGYKPRAFVPTTPFDLEAQYCCLEVGADGHVRAQNGDLIQNATIVEFSFDRDNADNVGVGGGSGGGGSGTSWRWRAHKVRQDKTSKLRAGISEFGNPFYVANQNWTSIHYPVTRAMITGEESAPTADDGADGDVYYEAAPEQYTAQPMINLVDFHNRVVKQRLIERVARSAFGGGGGGSGSSSSYGGPAVTAVQLRNTLIDFAVGKGGDVHKWAAGQAQFVLGLDLSRDNIFNPKNGAIVRARDREPQRGATTVYPKCIFLPADSSLNIRRAGTAFQTNENRGGHRVVSALFGDAPALPGTLSPQFQRVVAGGEDGQGGFRVACCMFALHYFWRSVADLHSFLRNLAECTALNGLFTGACFDGQEVFETLRDFQYAGADATTGPDVTGTQLAPFYMLHKKKDGRTLLSMAKKYTARTFENGPRSVGMCVSVYVDAIGRAHDEYLVHFPYFDTLMALYGFELVSEQEMVTMGFQATREGGRRTFQGMYDNVGEREARGGGNNVRKAFDMSEEEKKISFMNRFFVYRKKHAVSADTLDALHREHVLGAPGGTSTAAAAASSPSPPPPASSASAYPSSSSSTKKKRSREEEEEDSSSSSSDDDDSSSDDETPPPPKKKSTATTTTTKRPSLAFPIADARPRDMPPSPPKHSAAAPSLAARVAEMERDERRYVPAPTDNWIRKTLRSGAYDILPPNNGAAQSSVDGDGFFLALVAAYRSATTTDGNDTTTTNKWTVAKLREVLATEATQTVLESKRKEYLDAARAQNRLEQEKLQLTEKHNEAAAIAKDKTRSSTERKAQIAVGKQLAERIKDVKAQMGVVGEILEDSGHMQFVTTLAEFRNHVRQSKFWADEWAVAVLEKKLRMKTVVLQRDGRTNDVDDNDVDAIGAAADNVLQCGGTTTAGAGADDADFVPKHYVLLDREIHRGQSHYQLVSVDRRTLFTFEQLPLKVKTLVVDKCMERVGGSFGSIPAFRDFQVELRDVVPKTAEEIADMEDDEVEQGRAALRRDASDIATSRSTSTSTSTSLGVAKALERATTAVDSPGLFNPNILFRFHALSPDNEPGKVTGEKLPAGQRPKFALLQTLEHWRRKLDDAWTGAPFSVPEANDGGLRWSSVVHYLTAAPLRETNEAAYRALSLDAGGGTTLSPAQAVATITEAPATSKRKAARGIYMDDYLRGVVRVDLEALRTNALAAKFGQNVDVRTALLRTLDAQLHSTARGKEPVSDIPLMLVRAKLAAMQPTTK